MNRYQEIPLMLPVLCRPLTQKDQWEFSELVSCRDCDCTDRSDRVEGYRPAHCVIAQGVAYKGQDGRWKARVKGNPKIAEGRTKARAIQRAIYGCLLAGLAT